MHRPDSTAMEDVNYITISDNEDDEVEFIDQVYRVEPFFVDLTVTPKKGRKVLEELDEQSPQQPTTPRPSRPPTPPPEKSPQPSPQPSPQSQPQPEPQSQPRSQPTTQPAPQQQPEPRPHPTPQPQPQQQTQQPAQQQAQPRTQQQNQQHNQQHPSRQHSTDQVPNSTHCPPDWPSSIPQQKRPEVQHGPLNNHVQEKPRIPTPDQTIAPAAPGPVKRQLSDRELMVARKEQGNKKFRCNAFDEAVRCYRAALDVARKLEDNEMAAILHFNLAMSYDKLGSYAQAADECAAAVKINDQYVKAHAKRAEIYMARGKFDEAVICYEHICELDSTKRAEASIRIAKAKSLAARLKKPDQYEILGLMPHFTADQLKAAYKQKARAHHPDRHSDADVVTRRIHEKIFKEASEANTYFRKRFNFH